MVIFLCAFLPTAPMQGKVAVHQDASPHGMLPLMLSQHSLNEWMGCRTISRNQIQGSVHVKTELLSSEKVTSLSSPLKSGFCDAHLLHQRMSPMITVSLLATGPPCLYLNLGETIPHWVLRELILLSSVAVRNPSLRKKLALHNSELSPLSSKDVLLSFAAKALGIENARLVLT